VRFHALQVLAAKLQVHLTWLVVVRVHQLLYAAPHRVQLLPVATPHQAHQHAVNLLQHLLHIAVAHHQAARQLLAAPLQVLHLLVVAHHQAAQQ